MFCNRQLHGGEAVKLGGLRPRRPFSFAAPDQVHDRKALIAQPVQDFIATGARTDRCKIKSCELVACIDLRYRLVHEALSAFARQRHPADGLFVVSLGLLAVIESSTGTRRFLDYVVEAPVLHVATTALAARTTFARTLEGAHITNRTRHPRAQRREEPSELSARNAEIAHTGCVATTTLYRPVGQPELDPIAVSEWRRFPLRLHWQPIFYPVTNEPYATRIARDWNTKDAENGNIGYVLRFEIDATYLAQFDIQQVGDDECLEYWIPAEDLNTFNDQIVGAIEVVSEWRAQI